MPSSYSDLLRLVKQATGENSLTWGDLVNTGFLELIEDSVAGTATIDLTAGTGGYTLVSNNGTTDESRCAILKFTGSPTVNKNITVPTTSKIYVVYNALSTARTLTMTTGAGTTTALTQGQIDIIMVTSTGVISIVGDSLKKSSNLSDLANIVTARTNLGLGTASTLAFDIDGTLTTNSDTRIPTQKAVKTYAATAAQGALAATAVQPAAIVGLGGITVSAFTATTSGTTHDQNIASNIKQFKVNLSNVSYNVGAQPNLLLGTSGSFETTGYVTGVSFASTAAGSASSSAAIIMTTTATSSGTSIFSGGITFSLVDAATNEWSYEGVISDPTIPSSFLISGNKALASPLTRIRLGSTGGATFDAGKFNVVGHF